VTSKPRALYILRQYPLICETYIQTEIDALKDRYDVRVISLRKVDGADEFHDNPAPYVVLNHPARMLEEIQRFKPNVIHSHWLLDSHLILKLAVATQTPFTIRAHSFDTIYAPYMKAWFEAAPRVLQQVGRHELCLGIIAFPFSRGFLEHCGVPSDKIFDCSAVIKFSKFYDESPNGSGVMNVGACLPKKLMPAYLQLANETSELDFDLYPVGYDTDEINQLNKSLGDPVQIHRCVQHKEMPGIYKAHQWLVYTACPKLRNVGWPMAVAEAMASGTGVIMFDIRQDLRQYIGNAGYLCNKIDDIQHIIRQPVPETIREAGFEQAKMSDIENSIHLITDLWEKTHQ
jgi:glycosyltransferase involved in cell wall biosynthesis